MIETKIWLNQELPNYDYFSYIGNREVVYTTILELIDFFQLERLLTPVVEIKLRKLSNDQILMFKLSCPVPFNIYK